MSARRIQFIALTFVELLVALAILLFIAAIAFPIVKHAKWSALERSATEALRQNWLAVELYRQDYGGGLDFGTVAQMALPLDSSGFKFPVDPPYRNPLFLQTGHIFYPKEEGVSSPTLVEEWVRYSTICKDRSILLTDFNFNDHNPHTSSKGLENNGLGVLLNGTSKIQKRAGPLYDPFWWDCKDLAIQP
jgi:type II secretory pathway pseudopilin PulG